jgi:hypothetical protein
MKTLKISTTILMILVAFSCGKDKAPAREILQKFNLAIPANVTWLNTGIKMEPGKLITIKASDEAKGLKFIVKNDPMPVIGHRALIGRIGTDKDALPFHIGTGYALNTHSMNSNEYLFLGRNDTDLDQSDENGGPIAEIEAAIEVEVMKKTPLISPVDGLWSTNTSPPFVWENVEGAWQYVIDISQFSDFRILESRQTVSSSGSAGGSTLVSAGGTPASTSNTTLTEGLHYWRVRAQINIGRTLSPIYIWNDWSLTFKYGVALGNPPPSPVLINPDPSGPTSYAPNQTIRFDITSGPGPSHVLWRIRSTSGACGEDVTINRNDAKSGSPTRWMVFDGTIPSQNPSSPPQLYASHLTEALKEGNYLYYFEIRNGPDTAEQLVTFVQYNMTVGCSD